MTVSIALVEPLYYVNVGHVCRLMKNFGTRQLYLLNPKFDAEEAIKYSTHGKNILETSKKVRTIQQLRQNFDILIGSTAIAASSRLNVLRSRTSPEEMARIIQQSGNSKKICLLLGREPSGLNNKELELCDFIVQIDTLTNYKTLNIAHALAILLYEISRIKKTGKALTGKNRKKRIDLASKADKELLLGYVKKAADTSGYDDHKKTLLQQSFKRLLTKSNPNVKDVMLIVSLLRKCNLAIERKQFRT